MRKGRPDNPVFVVKIENTVGGRAAVRPRQGRPGARGARRGRPHPPRGVLLLQPPVEGRPRAVAAHQRHRHRRARSAARSSPPAAPTVPTARSRTPASRSSPRTPARPGFSSDPAKYRPYNRLINLKTVAKKAKRTTIKGPYLPWTPADATPAPRRPTGKRRRAARATVRFSDSTSTSWKLDGAQVGAHQRARRAGQGLQGRHHDRAVRQGRRRRLHRPGRQPRARDGLRGQGRGRWCSTAARSTP